MSQPPVKVLPHLHMTSGALRSVIFLFLLSLVLAAGNYLLSASAVRSARASSASAVQLCEAGNEARAQQVQLWLFVIALSPPPPRETAAARAARQKVITTFLAYVRSVFAPRDCAAALRPASGRR